MPSRYTVYLTSHFVEGRTGQLAITLESILCWPAEKIRAVIVSNASTYLENGFLDAWQQRFASLGHRLELEVARGLSNPLMLTWQHKQHLPGWVAQAAAEGDYFVYIEDDIALSAANLEYFHQHLPRLRKHGLLPGFMRYEICAGETRLVDHARPEPARWNHSCSIDGTTYHANSNPYWAGFILDRRLAAEYLQSRSFRAETSKFVGWGIQERAAMGLTFERVPLWMGARSVVPLVDGRPDPGCLVWHCSNAFSTSGHPTFGRLRPADAYCHERVVDRLARRARELPWASKHFAKRLLRYIRPDLELYP